VHLKGYGAVLSLTSYSQTERVVHGKARPLRENDVPEGHFALWGRGFSVGKVKKIKKNTLSPLKTHYHP